MEVGIAGIILTAIVGSIVAWLWKRVSNSVTAEDLKDFKCDIEKRLDRFEDHITKLTNTGIKEGNDGRKQQWEEINNLRESVAAIEGYLSNTNGYKKRG